jgi:hypothetical protein
MDVPLFQKFDKMRRLGLQFVQAEDTNAPIDKLQLYVMVKELF